MNFLKILGKAIENGLESTSSAAYKLFMQKLPGKSSDKEEDEACMVEINHKKHLNHTSNNQILEVEVDKDGNVIKANVVEKGEQDY